MVKIRWDLFILGLKTPRALTMRLCDTQDVQFSALQDNTDISDSGNSMQRWILPRGFPNDNLRSQYIL